MNITKELIKKYKVDLDGQYRKKDIAVALDIISCSAGAWDEDYNEDFEPPVWVVSAVCEALSNKSWWKPFYNE